MYFLEIIVILSLPVVLSSRKFNSNLIYKSLMSPFFETAITAAPIQIVSRSNENTNKVFFKYQNSAGGGFAFSPSDNFVYAPDMNQAFHVTKTTLFKITFQGSLYNDAKDVRLFLQIMVNDYLIVANRLIPNTNERSTGMDSIGGLDYLNGVGFSAIVITRVAMIYLPPGTYTLNVGVRSNLGTGHLLNGMVTYELIQFGVDQDLGDLKLATFPF